MLDGAAESFADALLGRLGERAVQYRGRRDVERLATVTQAAGDLAVVDEPRSWPERGLEEGAAFLEADGMYVAHQAADRGLSLWHLGAVSCSRPPRRGR